MTRHFAFLHCPRWFFIAQHWRMKWLKSLVGLRAAPHEKPQDEVLVFAPNRLVPSSVRHLIDGYEFVATLNLDTPLKWLLMHGKIEECPSEVPMQFGVWVPAPSTSDSSPMSVLLRKLPEATMASMFGPIPSSGGKVLKFLIEFRKVVESGMSDEHLRRCLSELEAEYPEFAERFDPSLHQVFSTNRLSEELKCGPMTARKLYAANFTTPEEVRAATVEKLCSIRGIGATTAQKLLG